LFDIHNIVLHRLSDGAARNHSGGVLKCGNPHDAFLDFTNHLHQAEESDMGTAG